jgi:translation initiation factor IF-2
LATVRIYKVAELLGITSQQVLELLRNDHGIELKSASSSLEEVVVRSVVERAARERNITLPSGDPFSAKRGQAPTATKAGKKAAALKKPEPPKPVAPVLGPPRLVKTIRAAEPEVAIDEVADTAPAQATVESVELAPEVAGPEMAAEPEPVQETPLPAEDAVVARVVPSTLRLRIEEPGRTLKPARLGTPVKRPPAQTQPRMLQPPVADAPPPRPSAQVARPGIPGRPGYASPRPTTPPSAPRPLPTMSLRPPARPGMPGHRPAFGRPFGGGRSRPVGGSRRERPQAPTAPVIVPPPPITRSVTLAEGMTVKDLSDKLEVRVKDVLSKLLMKRMMMTINSPLDSDTARDIAREFGADVEMRTFEEEINDVEVETSNPEARITRAPVVTMMGHVDHGKTSLLDAIRETRVAEREAGGITQHIGAYHVSVKNRSIVFLDTPGHEAFTLMRARGTKVTDIVVLVVAADDGIMPQTREAIDHARAANVPIVVVINKIDKSNANPENVKRELSELELAPEDWGGTTVTVEVSAKKKQNLEQLLELLLLSSDILELTADPTRPASGAVLESKLDKGRGSVATVLVQDGTLRVGDNFIAGPVVGRVRALIDDRGRHVKEAGPSTPVEVLGLTTLPSPGDIFQAVADASRARQIATFRQAQAKERSLGSKGGRFTLESLKEQMAEGGMKHMPIIVKGDVQGSTEVLADSLANLSDEKIRIRIIHSGVGAINESDVLLATASNAIIIGFNVRPDRNAATVAAREQVDIRHHTVIYKVTDEIKLAMAGLLDPTFKEVRLGVAEVREVFRTPKAGTVAGCMITEGTIRRGGETQVRLLRAGEAVHEGKISGLRRFKDDVSEVKKGFECGVSLDHFNDIQVGDVIELVGREKVLTPVTAQ